MMIHKTRWLIISILFSSIPLLGEYWQQWVEYEMDVYLDTDQKSLTASSDLVYVNNSPDTLKQMLMHLYPNAYNQGTIAESVIEKYGGSFDPEKGWTGIQILTITEDSLDLAFSIRDDTILEILLNHPLLPGDTLSYSLDWTSLIHPHIDRSGWDNGQFDLTQWYPKFVVYDENGWHDDPFGDWGEFYGEFGKYIVHLDIPADQVVAATGVVMNGDPGWAEVAVDTSKEWQEWHEQFLIERESQLADLDSLARRQVSFLAEKVHDFAWLCSPDFVYEHGKWNGIDVNVVFTTKVGKDWNKDVVRWGERAMEWLSRKFGMYPWPQITIARSLGTGGMEYPMLVLDHTDSESLVVHEIGHNWFYGIFGNDELDEAWLDEGLTSFQTRWYLEHYYSPAGYALSRGYLTPFEADHLPRQSYLERDLKPTLKYMLSTGNQPIAMHSFDFNSYRSYNYNAYEKPAIMLDMLKNYLGEERFLAGMQLYYSRWALKHVNEDRFIQAMEDASGEELDWLFDQWLHTTHYVDYKLEDWSVVKDDQDHFRTEVNVDNRGGMFVPLKATVYGPHDEAVSVPLEDFRFREHGVINIVSSFEPMRVNLDAENAFYDADRRDNDSQWKCAWRYDYKGWNEYPDDRNLYLWKPRFAYNDASGLGLGLNLKRVYRLTGNFTQMSIDHNFTSGNPDASISFRQNQPGLPFEAVWMGEAKSWRSLIYSSLAYEMNWSRNYWANPMHYLTLKIESTDAKEALIPVADRTAFTRLGIQYEYQDEVLDGDLGLNVSIYNSPAKLGSYAVDFSQLFMMGNWTTSSSLIKFNNRLNLLANTKGTPRLVKSRVASQDVRSVYLDRVATSLQGVGDIEKLGSSYYLRGGGRMRAYTDSLDQPMNYIWSNNMDLTIRSLPFMPHWLEFGCFLDLGQVSQDAENWENVGDLGVSFNYQPDWKRTNWLNTFIRPIQIKLDLNIIRYENSQWVNVLPSDLWVFSLSI